MIAAKKHAIFIVRYSLYMPKSPTAWQIGRKNEEEKYKSILFNESRLRLRRFTFANITVPSIAEAIQSASDVSAEIHVLTSELLPQEDKDFLYSLTRTYPFLKIYFFDDSAVDLDQSSSNYVKQMNAGDVIATIRIDDDDGVSKDFLSQLSAYMLPEFHGLGVSLCAGYGALLNAEHQICALGPRNWRFAAVGMARIFHNQADRRFRSVFKMGNHMTTDERHATIVDARKPSIISIFHADNDSSPSFKKHVPEIVGSSEISEIKELFAMTTDAWAI